MVNAFSRRRSLVLMAAFTLLAGCGDVRKALHEAEGLHQRYEARGWFTRNRDHWAFAESRFRSTAAALAFVDTLYRFGAESVYVTGVMTDSLLSLAHGGPYSETLIVRLPQDTMARSHILELGAREARHSDFHAVANLDERTVVLWWR